MSAIDWMRRLFAALQARSVAAAQFRHATTIAPHRLAGVVIHHPTLRARK